MGQASTGSTILDYCDGYAPDETLAGLAFDARGRVIAVPVGGGAWPDVRLARLTSAGGGLDPAWGCGRAVRLPAFCPPGATCPGVANGDAWTTATDALVTTGDAVIVIGNQRRQVTTGAEQAVRGFIAKVLP